MTQSINQALVTQFGDRVHLLAQQMGSRMKGKVMEMPVRGNTFTWEQLGQVEAIEITTRHAETKAQDIDHLRRGAPMRDFRTTLYLDQFDDLQVLIDPARQYAAAVARSLMRKYDQIAIEAALGIAYSGKDLSTPITAAQDGVPVINAGATGLTFDKLCEIHETFINNEIGVDMGEELFLAITGSQHADLMKENELTSRDFTNAGNSSMVGQTVIDKGVMTKAGGFNLIVFGNSIRSPMIKATGNVRHCVAFAKSGVAIGMNKDIGVRVDNRPDKNNLQQVQASMFLGGVRTEGNRVVQVDCVEL